MKAENIFPKSLFSHYFSQKKGNRRKGHETKGLWWLEGLRQYQVILGNLTAMVVTGSLFLGGSYLFFIQLAEYGW